jgi:hypothetical protein
MKLKNIIIGLGLISLCTAESCTSERTSDGHIGVIYNELSGTNTPSIDTKRFSVQSFGTFNAGYGHNTREILEIVDTKTGHKYIGITGVGITEEVQYGKTQNEE